MSPLPLGIVAVSGVAPAGAYELLQSVVTTTTTGDITFSGLSSYAADYKHLQLRVIARGSQTTTSTIDMQIRFNTDGGANYGSHAIEYNGSSATSINQTGQTSIRIKDVVPNTNSTAGCFGAFITDILDFGSTSKTKTTKTIGGSRTNSEVNVQVSSGLWNNTAALTQVQVYPSAGFFIAGCRLSLYGIRG